MNGRRRVAAVVILVAAMASLPGHAKTLFDPAQAAHQKQISLDDLTVARANDRDGQLTLAVGTTKKWPGIRIRPAARTPWNLSDWSAMAVDIENHGADALTVHVRIDNPLGTRGLREPWITRKHVVAPGERKSLRAPLRRAGNVRPALTGMQTFPQGLDDDGIDPSRVASVLIFFDRAADTRSFSLGPLRALKPYTVRPWERFNSKQFFPFVDEFGQFRHDAWNKKVGDLDALATQRRLEDADLAAHPGPDRRSPFGGWQDGPRMPGSGHFSVRQHDGKWWLVDPQGYLFWSHGLGVVRTESRTIISDRERYFPSAITGETNTPFHATQDDPDANPITTFDFTQANLAKKYGATWRDVIAQRIAKRLQSWGFNTYGLWSDQAIARAGKLPYTQWVYYQSPALQGSFKTGRMVDMWHSQFVPQVERAAGKLDALNDDPWLLGVFVDNELRWSDAGGFLTSVLRSPSEQPAKQKLLSFLQEKYGSIKSLNDSWSLRLDAWDNFLELSASALKKAPAQDVTAFYALSADHYYRSIAHVIRAHAPDKLYLCSRFNGRFPVPEQAAAKHCDVISYNLYRTSVADFRALGQHDKPVLISEWHFGTRDRGMFGAGLVEVADQNARADAYAQYLTGALQNPLIVGAHWFQYQDEPLTGRALDGENYQIGFVSVTDTPYARLAEAARRMGQSMYALRADD